MSKSKVLIFVVSLMTFSGMVWAADSTQNNTECKKELVVAMRGGKTVSYIRKICTSAIDCRKDENNGAQCNTRNICTCVDKKCQNDLAPVEGATDN